jgi:hypothetical protein
MYATISSTTGPTQPSCVSSNTPWFFNGMRIRSFRQAEDQTMDHQRLAVVASSMRQFWAARSLSAERFHPILFNPGTDTLGNRIGSATPRQHQVRNRRPVKCEGRFTHVRRGCRNGGGVSCSAARAAPPAFSASWRLPPVVQQSLLPSQSAEACSTPGVLICSSADQRRNAFSITVNEASGNHASVGHR